MAKARRSSGKMLFLSILRREQSDTNVFHLEFFVDSEGDLNTLSCSKCSRVAARLFTGKIFGRGVSNDLLCGRYLLDAMI